MKLTLILCICLTIVSINAKHLAKRDVRDDLLKRVDQSLSDGKVEIEKLRNEKRTTIADNLEKEAKEIRALADELKTTTGAEGIKLLTDKLSTNLKRFELEVQGFAEDSKTRENVLAMADKLVAEVEEEVKTLRSNGRIIPADLLERQGTKLKQLSEALRSATIDIAVKAVEAEINLLALRINADLKLLGYEHKTETPVPSTLATAAPTKTSPPLPTTLATVVPTKV